MSRSIVVLGASVLMVQLACVAPPPAVAQTAASQLPPVTVDAPPERQAKPKRPPGTKAAGIVKRRAKAVRTPLPAMTAQPVATAPVPQTAATFRASLNQSPTGQTATTVQRERYEDRPAFSVSDVLRESPGVEFKQGNGPRDIGISIRGSNARNGFGIRNSVIFDDGFPVTQPDGLSRSDLIDPHAYGAIDVIRGPSSALYGNYATGGALNFRTRPGGEINGTEYGLDAGSFGYLSNYLALGKKAGGFEASLFASDARGNGFISNSQYNTQTLNFLGIWRPTADDRFTVKVIDNQLETRLPIRLSLNQFYMNPFQAGCVTGATAAPGCGTVTLFNNGFNKAAGTDTETAGQAGLGRHDRRSIVGGRWEHDIDNDTTWRNQFVFDDRDINQPTGTTSTIGDFPSYNYMSDITHRGRLYGLDTTTYFGAFYNTLSWSSDTRNVMPGGNATLGSLSANLTGTHTNFGARGREEIKFTDALTGVAGLGWEITQLKGINTAYSYPGPGPTPTAAIINVDRQFQNLAPEAALLYKINSDWLLHARVSTGYGTPQVGDLVVLANGQFGNNTQLDSQRNLGYDVGFDWTPTKTLKVSVTGFYEFFQNELVLQATPAGAPKSSYTFNAPRSEHRGIEVAVDWRFLEGWRLTTAFTYLDQFYTSYVENLTNGATFSFDRAGNKIPGISPNELTARLGYDQPYGALKGLGGFVEVQWKDAFYMDNANLLRAPAYELLNANVHYNTDLSTDYLKRLSIYFEVRNILNTTYVASANNIGNSVTAAGIQNPGSVLANTTGSIYAGSPRAFMGGLKLAFQ